MTASPLLRFLLPETVLLATALSVLLCSLSKRARSFSGAAALAGVLGACFCVPAAMTAGPGPFLTLLVNDPFSWLFKLVCLFAAGAVILFSMGYRGLAEEYRAEYYFLLLCGTIAMLFAVSSHHLLMIYLALEMLSLVSYLLVAFRKRDALSSEGALKYFIFGALSTGILLYGISLVFGLFGTLDLSAIFRLLSSGPADAAAASVAFLMILAGLSFKCAFVPFHMWVPDVYQGAPTAVTAFISVGPKAVGFAVLIRLFTVHFAPFCDGWTDLLTLVAVLTMTAGNVIALTQTNIKRMLGYSSVAHAGFILIGLVAGNAIGLEGVFYYVLAYALMNLGAFGCVVLIGDRVQSDAIKDYAGLYRTMPVPAFMLTVFLLSLAGVPPLAGFLAKFLVFAGALEAGRVTLAVAGAVNSVVAAFYYMKIIRSVYLTEAAAEPRPAAKSLPLELALWLLLAGVLVAGIFPQPVLEFLKTSNSFFHP